MNKSKLLTKKSKILFAIIIIIGFISGFLEAATGLNDFSVKAIFLTIVLPLVVTILLYKIFTYKKS